MVGSAVHARIVRICAAAAGDALVLRQHVLTEIRGAVDFDAYAWLLTDPETSVGVSPLADVPIPLLPELPRLVRAKYLTEVNRWTALGASAATLHRATGGDLSRSRLWLDVLNEFGVVDVASAVFRDRFGCWGFLDLWRMGGRTPFSDGETAFLTGIMAPVTAALRRCQASTFTPWATQPRPPGPVVLLLSPELGVLGQTPSTHAYLRVLVPPAQGQAPIPASAYNVAAQLLAVEAGIDHNPPSARVHLADGLWLSLRAARIEPNIAVTVEEASPPERVSLFARAFGLSPRETELLGHLVSGTDTRELARRMVLSEHTVQDHLKSIFAKTSTHNRRSLLSRALG